MVRQLDLHTVHLFGSWDAVDLHIDQDPIVLQLVVASCVQLVVPSVVAVVVADTDSHGVAAALAMCVQQNCCLNAID